MNTNQKELILIDLYGRLPFGVKLVTITRNVNATKGVIEKKIGYLVGISKPIYFEDLIGMFEHLTIEVQFKTGDFEIDYKINDVRQILYSTDCINEEITVNGYNNNEPFVPMDMIRRDVYYPDWDKSLSSHLIYLLNELRLGGQHEQLPIWVIGLFNEWHIDYRHLIRQGLAINVKTLSQNPYL